MKELPKYADLPYNVNHDYTAREPNPFFLPGHGDIIKLRIGFCRVRMNGGFLLDVLGMAGERPAYVECTLGVYDCGAFVHIAHCTFHDTENGIYADTY